MHDVDIAARPTGQKPCSVSKLASKKCEVVSTHSRRGAEAIFSKLGVAGELMNLALPLLPPACVVWTLNGCPIMDAIVTIVGCIRLMGQGDKRRTLRGAPWVLEVVAAGRAGAQNTSNLSRVKGE